MNPHDAAPASKSLKACGAEKSKSNTRISIFHSKLAVSTDLVIDASGDGCLPVLVARMFSEEISGEQPKSTASFLENAEKYSSVIAQFNDRQWVVAYRTGTQWVTQFGIISWAANRRARCGGVSLIGFLVISTRRIEPWSLVIFGRLTEYQATTIRGGNL